MTVDICGKCETNPPNMSVTELSHQWMFQDGINSVHMIRWTKRQTYWYSTPYKHGLANIRATEDSLYSQTAGCLKKFSVLQAQLWDHLVLRTILAFLLSGIHIDHDSRAFFAKKWPNNEVKFWPWIKIVTFMQVLYECLKVKTKNNIFFFFLHFVLRAALAMLATFRHPARRTDRHQHPNL